MASMAVCDKQTINMRMISDGENIYYLLPSGEFSRKDRYWWNEYSLKDNDNITVESGDSSTTIKVVPSGGSNATSAVGPTGKPITSSSSGVLYDGDKVAVIARGEVIENPDSFSYTLVRHIDNNYNMDYSKDEEFRSTYTVDNISKDQIDENTTLCICEGGADGVYTDIKGKIVDSETVQGSNVALINVAKQTQSDIMGATYVADKIAADTPADSTRRVYMGHSTTGTYVSKAAVEYLRTEHAQGKETKTMLALNDSTGERSIFNELSDSDDLDDLKDSLVFVSAQSRYVSPSESGSYNVSGRMATYYGDLQKSSEAGADILIALYQDDGLDEHTTSCSVTAELGMCDPYTAKLQDTVYAVGKERAVTYYRIDEFGNMVKFENTEAAQAYLDTSVGKIELFNGGYLHDSDGKYYLDNDTEAVEIGADALADFARDFKISNMSYEEFLKANEGKFTYDKDGKIIGYESSAVVSSGGTDAAEFNYRDTLAAVETLKASLDSIGGHINSLGDINGLGIKTNPHSSFLSDMNAYPSGINTQGFQNAQDCLSKMCAQVENAYNVAVGVHTALLHAEDMAPTYYKSNTYADKATQTNTEPFATDVSR